MTRNVIITGANGGIGSKLCSKLAEKGWNVIATDLNENILNHPNYLKIDLYKYSTDSLYRKDKTASLIKKLKNNGLKLLINNAAYQFIAPFKDISIQEWNKTLNINLTAPFLLIRYLMEELKLANGSVINISSIHNSLTKSNFIAYSTSKSALLGLTRALSVELGDLVRFNSISPAAINTPMLQESFNGDESKIEELKYCHPSKTIGSVDEIVDAVNYLGDSDSLFVNGVNIELSGGINSKLHDPD